MKIGYARVSTADQNLHLQEDALDHAGCERIFSDKGSGVSKDRPGLKEALSFMRGGDTLVVWRLDRLARSLKDLIQMMNHLHEKEIHLKSLQEGIDTSSLNGKLVFHIFASIAEFERELIRERTKAGLTAARARGRQGGRPRKLHESEIHKLQDLMANPHIAIDDLKKMFGVGKTALYRYAKMKKSPQ